MQTHRSLFCISLDLVVCMFHAYYEDAMRREELPNVQECDASDDQQRILSWAHKNFLRCLNSKYFNSQLIMQTEI
jgi:hypothetical protein